MIGAVGSTDNTGYTISRGGMNVHASDNLDSNRNDVDIAVDAQP